MTSKLRGEEGGKKSPNFADFQYSARAQDGPQEIERN